MSPGTARDMSSYAIGVLKMLANQDALADVSMSESNDNQTEREALYATRVLSTQEAIKPAHRTEMERAMEVFHKRIQATIPISIEPTVA